MPQKINVFNGLVLFRNRSRKWGLSASASPVAVAHGARTTPHPYVYCLCLVLALPAARIREALRKGRKGGEYIFQLAMEKRPILSVVCYQSHRAALRTMAITLFALISMVSPV